MKSRNCRCRGIAIGSAWGAEAPNSTRTIAVATAVTGAAVCITMQSWQWSASTGFEWR